MKSINRILNLLIIAAFFTGAGYLMSSCEDWTETESVDRETLTPDKQNPELYAKYTQAVRDYKKRNHYAVCVHFENGLTGSGEKDYLRSLPDSIDVVVLKNADALTPADLEDLPKLQQLFATNFLFGLDINSFIEEVESKGKELQEVLSPAFDEMIALISENELDGASIAYKGDIDPENETVVQLQQLILSKVEPLAKVGKILYFEGNPLFIPKESRELFNAYVLNSTSVMNALELQLLIEQSAEYAEIPLNKILITADPELMIRDNENNLVSQIPFLSEQVINCGPVGGILIRNAMNDYHAQPNKTYYDIRNAVQTLNPSPFK